MAYFQVEASVRTNRKFLNAGPAASWLWICGMGYCQDGLTDGFIAFEALEYLGVKVTTAKKLKTALVTNGLWDEVPGGWMVHDYLKHNRSASDIATTKDRRKAGGNLGGRPPKETSSETFEVISKVNHPVNPDQIRSETSQIGSAQINSPTPQFDVWLARLQAEYPQNRVTYGFMTSSAFFEIFQKDDRPAEDVWAEIRGNLDNQKSGHEWRVKGMVPKLEKWLAEGLWKQRHQSAPVSTLVTEKTARTLSSAAQFAKGGGRG